MDIQKAIEIVKMTIATKNDKNEVELSDYFQFAIAATVIMNTLTNSEIQRIFNE
jgi:hypothetical protein